MRAFIYDTHAAVLRADGVCELFIADVTTIDRLRTHDLARLGLPAEPAMLALSKEARRIVTRADLFKLPGLTYSPYLLWIDGRTGEVLARWEAVEAWAIVLQRLREAARDAA